MFNLKRFFGKVNNRFSENRRIPNSIAIPFFVILLALIIGALSWNPSTLIQAIRSSKPTSETTASPQASPELIECFINGKSVMATRDICRELSKQPATTPTSSPTQKPSFTTQIKTQPIKTPPPSPSPSPERKKVSLFIDDYGGITKGNFYCYEDKANHLADLQNQIRIKHISSQGCSGLASTEGTNCSNSNCSSLINDVDAFNNCSKKCFDDAYAKCSSNVGDLRKQLYNDVQQFCP